MVVCRLDSAHHVERRNVATRVTGDPVVRTLHDTSRGKGTLWTPGPFGPPVPERRGIPVSTAPRPRSPPNIYGTSSTATYTSKFSLLGVGCHRSSSKRPYTQSPGSCSCTREGCGYGSLFPSGCRVRRANHRGSRPRVQSPAGVRGRGTGTSHLRTYAPILQHPSTTNGRFPCTSESRGRTKVRRGGEPDRGGPADDPGAGPRKE